MTMRRPVDRSSGTGSLDEEAWAFSVSDGGTGATTLVDLSSSMPSSRDEPGSVATVRRACASSASCGASLARDSTRRSASRWALRSSTSAAENAATSGSLACRRAAAREPCFEMRRVRSCRPQVHWPANLSELPLALDENDHEPRCNWSVQFGHCNHCEYPASES